MKNALDEVDAAFTQKTGINVLVSYAASSALMKQIEQGAPANVFVSADLKWMDYGSQKKLIQDSTRINLLGNRLVLVAPKETKIGNVTIAPGFDVAALAGGGRIATGDVSAVPAGLCGAGRAWRMGLRRGENGDGRERPRSSHSGRARRSGPRNRLRTDAKVEPGVKIVGIFPEDSHPPIIYPVALTANAKPYAAQYLDYLRTEAAKSVFERYGFIFLIKPIS